MAFSLYRSFHAFLLLLAVVAASQARDLESARQLQSTIEAAAIGNPIHVHRVSGTKLEKGQDENSIMVRCAYCAEHRMVTNNTVWSAVCLDRD